MRGSPRHETAFTRTLTDESYFSSFAAHVELCDPPLRASCNEQKVLVVCEVLIVDRSTVVLAIPECSGDRSSAWC